MPKKSSSQKAQELEEKIKKAQQRLKKLKQKRQLEIGKLAETYGLDRLSNEELGARFKAIACTTEEV